MDRVFLNLSDYFMNCLRILKLSKSLQYNLLALTSKKYTSLELIGEIIVKEFFFLK